MVSLTISAPVLAVALAAPRVGLLADALGRKGVIFACQAAASSYVGKAAGKAHSLAASLYVALYYLAGSIGSIIPDFF